MNQYLFILKDLKFRKIFFFLTRIHQDKNIKHNKVRLSFLNINNIYLMFCEDSFSFIHSFYKVPMVKILNQ